MSQARNAVAAKAQALFRSGFTARILPWRKRCDVDHPLANAKHLARMIDELPLNDDPRQALENVNHRLASIQQTPAFSAAQRYTLVSALDTATRASQAHLLEQYVAQRRERVIEEKRVWQTMTEFWTLLAQGYLDCAQACGESGPLPRDIEACGPRIAARGLRALRYQLKWRLLRYADIPADVWPACGRFLTLAERGAAAATPLSLYDDDKTPTSPHTQMLRLAMFHSVSPASLSPAEQHVAERLVVYLTRKFRIDSEHHDRYDYCFDSRGIRPPSRRTINAPAAATLRYLDVSDARYWTGAAHALVCGTGHLPADLDLGAAVQTTTVTRVLQHLNVQWAKAAPPRATGRQKVDADLQAVHGYPNVVRVVAAPDHGRTDDSDTQPLPMWAAADMSRNGYGVITPAGAAEALQVGDIVALRIDADPAWAVGVIRRIQARTDHRRHVGLQLLTQAAVAVQVRTMTSAARDTKRQPAILLDERPLPDGSLYIVARKGLLDTREAIEARFGAEGTSVILEPSGLVESGTDYDWLRYRMTSVAF